MNKHLPHVYVIPEDDADGQLANGFVNHSRVESRSIRVMPPAGGWNHVLKIFQSEYIGYLRKYSKGHVVLLIDFDGCYLDRRHEFAEAIPEDLRERVFVIGAEQTPEKLRNELNMSFETIGMFLAEDCHAGTASLWGRNQLAHNDSDLQRLLVTVRPFLYGP